MDSDRGSPWMTLPEAAAYLRVAEGTMARYVRMGLVPKHKMGPLGTVRFHRDELDQLLSVPSTEQPA